jgi:hypothetical protein
MSRGSYDSGFNSVGYCLQTSAVPTLSRIALNHSTKIKQEEEDGGGAWYKLITGDFGDERYRKLFFTKKNKDTSELQNPALHQKRDT